jgi:hypothetical protein
MPLAVRIRNQNSDAIPKNPGGYGNVIAGITKITVNKIWGNLDSHIVPDQNNWRIDRQNPSADGANIQVQRNGVDGKSTIGCVIVPNKYNISKPPSTSATKAKVDLTHDARLGELAKAVRSGLTQSAQSWMAPVRDGELGRISTYEVSGDFSA